MAEFIQIAQVSELKDGAMKEANVNGHHILIARSAGKYYAADNVCPHMGGNLAKGTLMGTIVTCPVHASQFDLTDGHVIRWTNWSGAKLALAKMFKPPRGIKVYKVKTEGNQVLAELDVKQASKVAQ